MHIFSVKRITGLLLGLFVVVSASTFGLAQTKSAAPSKSAANDGKALKNPVKATPESIQAGQKTYQASCVPCHGESGKGDGPVAKNMATKPADLTAPKLPHGSSDGELFTSIRDGIGPEFKMKAFKGKIADPDMWNIVNYIHSLREKK